MPELPEVETICCRLRDGGLESPSLLGRRVMDVRVLWPRTIATPSARRFPSRLRGQRVREVARRGKFLLIRLSNRWLAVHLRMSGSLVLERAAVPLSPYARWWARLGRGWRLTFRDPRTFGRTWLLADPAPLLARLGPEPLSDELSAEEFSARLRAHRRLIKPLLLDQTFIAGMGNIYTDETLHRAGIHPRARSDRLSRVSARCLWRAMRQVLREAIRHNGTSFDAVYGGGEFLRRLRVYRRTGHPCRRCGQTIKRTLVGQRGTHYCPRCQRR